MDFNTILSTLQTIGETDKIEAKKASQPPGESLLQTISAFCNEPGQGGGYLILGLLRNDSHGSANYDIAGVTDADRSQCEIATLCRQNFSRVVRPNIEVVTYGSKKLLVVFIPEADPHEKPVYIKTDGIAKGTYRRIGPTDQRCSREDIDLLYRLSSQKQFDETIREDAFFEDLSQEAIQTYRQLRADVSQHASELKYNDKDLLQALSVFVSHHGAYHPTAAGLILFGTSSALRRIYPISTRIDYIMIGGKEWVPDPDHRYHSIEIREGLLTAIPRLQEHIMSDIPQAFALDEHALQRIDNPILPRNVIREAVANTLMHRDYTIHQPIQIRRYSNRLEFTNAGYSLKPEEEMELPGSVTRNPKIAAILHDVNLAEIKGTGMHAMRGAMQKANLTVPLIESKRHANQFTLTLLTHHLFSEKDISWLETFRDSQLNNEQAKALIVLREMGALTNTDYRTINGVDTLTASTHLRSLRDSGLLQQKGRGSKTYYVPTQKLYSTPDISPKTPDISLRDIAGTEQETSMLPARLLEQLASFPKKAPSNKVKEMIRAICAHGHFEPKVLAKLLNRDSEHLRKRYLKDMASKGELYYLYPDHPNSPRQAYGSQPAAGGCLGESLMRRQGKASG